MKISLIEKESFNNYPKKISSIIFVSGCNYKCGYCHNPKLLSADKSLTNKEIDSWFEYLDKSKGWIEGVVLCGGEPTLESDLIDFTRKLKKRDLSVKLDTNGSKPEVLQNLLDEKIIDYVAMDVKGPKNLYSEIVGKEKVNVKNIENSIKIVQNFPDYEFRTTVAPINKDGEINFMTVKEIVNIAKWVVEITGENKHKYFLQPFVPRKGELLDSRFERFPETSRELLEEMQEKVIKYLPNCEIR